MVLKASLVKSQVGIWDSTRVDSQHMLLTSRIMIRSHNPLIFS